LLIVLSALLANTQAFAHQAADGSATPGCAQHLDAQDDGVSNDAVMSMQSGIALTTALPHVSQQDRQVTNLLVTMIFHPPQTRC